MLTSDEFLDTKLMPPRSLQEIAIFHKFPFTVRAITNDGAADDRGFVIHLGRSATVTGKMDGLSYASDKGVLQGHHKRYIVV